MDEQSIHEAKIFYLQERRMSAAVLTRSLQKREQARNGGSQDAARVRLARRLGIAPGTIYNLLRDRLKRVDHSVRERIVQYAILDIQQEIRRLDHELQIARQVGVAQNSKLVSQAEQLRADFEKVYSEITGIGPVINRGLTHDT